MSKVKGAAGSGVSKMMFFETRLTGGVYRCLNRHSGFIPMLHLYVMSLQGNDNLLLS